MTKIAILIDGAYFLKRLPKVCPRVNYRNAESVNKAIQDLVNAHLKRVNDIVGTVHPRSLLYRIFYYDAKPYAGRGHYPISKNAINYEESKEAQFRLALFDHLRKSPSTAIRLGEVRKTGEWVLRADVQAKLLEGKITIGDLKDKHFRPPLRQKAVDMRIGLDIASITLKRQADTIILVSGDADFVPAAKLARREGVRVILDPLWQSVAPGLFEHIDGLYSGFPNPKTGGQTKTRNATDHKQRARDAYPHLVQVAQKRGKITYAEISAKIDLHQRSARWFLSEIQDYCEREDLPPLQAVAVYKSTGFPGDGYKATKTREEYEDALERVYNYDWPPKPPF